MRTYAQKQKPIQKNSSVMPGHKFSGQGQSHDVSSILHPYRTIGNHAVQRSMKADCNTSEGSVARDYETSPVSNEVLHSQSQPLDPAMKAFFEQRFNHDFSQVRVHTNGAAAQSTRSINASAYTIGQDIVFGGGMYRPQSARGQHLIAHELAHVVQQSLPGRHDKGIETHHSPDERQAENAATSLRWGELGSLYGIVSLDVKNHQGMRPSPVLPTLSPSGALIQRVELTYDDGPDTAGNTQTVLTALNAASARATFYLVGKRIAQGKNWKIVFDIAAAGHWIGNHAYDWNDSTDNHIFLNGSVEDRAQKILQTEWAIRDALIQGRDDAKKNNKWTTIPQANRNYIDDLIAKGTGRFRTPGFRSHIWKKDGVKTRAALASVNKVLAATGLRPLAITEVSTWGISHEGVSVDPEDWRSTKSQSDIETSVKDDLSSNDDSVLLHSRIAKSAAATPAIATDIKKRGWSFDPTAQGKLGSVGPGKGFAGLSKISNPPTSAEIAKARKFLKARMLSIGPILSGSVALGIFQLAQRAGTAEVNAFAAEIKATTIQTKQGPAPMANWLNANEEWRLFAGFFENWVTKKPFPRIKGVTI